MYYELYTIFQNTIFGIGSTLTEFQDMTLTILSTICTLFVLSIPFICVFWVLKLIFRIWG